VGADPRLRPFGRRPGLGHARANGRPPRGPRAWGDFKATGLGAASSSCSYAAIAIAKSIFQKGAGLPAAIAFMFASTNLVFEIGFLIAGFVALVPERDDPYMLVGKKPDGTVEAVLVESASRRAFRR
jgi:hypothetical protein